MANLRKWRSKVFKRDHRLALFGSSVILDDALITSISSIGKVSLQTLRLLLQPRWTWWDHYGEELHEYLQTLEITYIPIESKRRKNTAVEEDPRENVYVTGRLVHRTLHVMEPPDNPDALYVAARGFAHCTVMGEQLFVPHDEVTVRRKPRATRKPPRRKPRASTTFPQMDAYTALETLPITTVTPHIPGSTMPLPGPSLALQQPHTTPPSNISTTKSPNISYDIPGMPPGPSDPRVGPSRATRSRQPPESRPYTRSAAKRGGRKED